MVYKHASAEVLQKVTALRHELHADPELGFQERNTNLRILKRLGLIEGLSVQPSVAKTGIIADLNSGNTGPCVALRADIDALPIKEQNEDCVYRSKNDGIMHACGHDGHTAALVGAAMALSKIGDHVGGRVRFIFQPAEEGLAGAKSMIAEGALEGVDAIFGFHNWPSAPFGTVCLNSATIMAAADPLIVRICGKGGHASAPHTTTDPVVAAAHLITALQAIPSRFTDPLESVVISICTLQASEARTVIPNEVRLGGSIRTLTPASRDKILKEIVQVTEGIVRAFGCTAEIADFDGYPATINTASEAALVSKAAARVVGAAAVNPNFPPSLASEDFSFYLQQKPGAFWFLGAQPAASQPDGPALHTSNFNFNDGLLPLAIEIHVETVLEYFGSR